MHGNLTSSVFQLRDQLEDLLVSHGDVIALQHDAGPASLIHCQSSPHSLWRQPVFALNLTEWFWVNNTPVPPDNLDADPLPDPELDLKALVEGTKGSWLENAVCPVRVLYVGQSETRLRGAELSAGLPQPGLYNLLVRSLFHLTKPLVFPCLCVYIIGWHRSVIVLGGNYIFHFLTTIFYVSYYHK